MHLENLRAPTYLLDDLASDVRTRCGGSNRPDETTLLVWKLLGTGSHPRPLGRSLAPLQSNPQMGRWQRWGREVLRQGDIVFRLGDARVVRGMVPLSRFIARATGSPFSHTGVVAIEDGLPVIYDCSAPAVQRQPFEVWMLDSLGAPGVKRLKLEHRERIAGVMDYCLAAYERQVPFDNGFRMEDDSFYCVEFTEKAFRSQGLGSPSLFGLATGSTWRAFL